MCDTLVVLGNSSQDGSVLFGKNSDRDPNEAHMICHIPRGEHEAGERLKCQYISVEQPLVTYSVILSKPAWLKIGCEMGANELGVVMGNEAVFTKEKYENENVLLGMDLVTLTLQRAKTASDGVTILTNLLEKYGQGGVASLIDPHLIYHNSFIIADPNSAWVVETANKYWVAKKVRDVASISNGLTIQDKWDLAAPGLVENAIQHGWCESKSEFNFATCYSDPEKRILSGCLERQSTTINGLLDKKGQIITNDIMDILRSHDKQPFRPDKGTMSSVCGHYSSQTIHQTTGSYVASLSSDFQVHWLTGTSAPCLSVFKPFFFENPTSLDNLKTPSVTNDNESLWWMHEKLHRLALMDYLNRAPVIQEQSHILEQELLQDVKEVQKDIHSKEKVQLKQELGAVSLTALNQNFTLIKKLTDSVSSMEIIKAPRKVFSKFWLNLSEKDGLSLN